MGYLNIVLWGRSMGGVSAVLYYSKFKHTSIRCIILDSPFYSFEQIAL
jgi:pimeloyl-ACP methyl ester carboxylesterase